MATRITRLYDREFELDNFWKKFLFAFYCYRCASSVFAQLVILRLTLVGDTWSYQQGKSGEGFSDLGALEVVQKAANFADFQASTHFTGLIGRVFNLLFLGNPILINIGFQTIAYVGIVYLLMSVSATQRLRLAILLALPSFTIWTSMASKECIVVFAVCVLGGGLIRLYYGRYKFTTIQFVALAAIWVYKPHYVPALFYLLTVTVLGTHVKQKAFVALLIGLFSLAALFVFRDAIDEMSFGVQRGFTTYINVGSTRTDLFFVHAYDVFSRMHIGFVMAFIGPTIEETLASPLHLFSFVESVVLLSILFFYIVPRLPRLPIYSVITGMFFTFWVLFPNYPFGVMKPGSANRYRAGWIAMIFIAFAVLQSRNLYLNWQNATRWQFARTR